MFTRARIYGGDSYLKNHLSANDYYAEGEKVTGRWIGKGAELLGLSGEVEPAAFESLRINCVPGSHDNLTPRTKDTRQPTTKEAKDTFSKKHGRSGSAQEVENFRLSMKPLPNRVAFYDFQCSAQKSVSIMALLVDDRLRAAHEDAVRIAFQELEQFASRQKNTLTKRDWEFTGNLCAAAFTHDASRALDPQLHTHFVIANATRSAEGRWYALEECHIYKAVRYAGKVYQNELAAAARKLGYEIREPRDRTGEVTGFEIEGVSDELCERYSKRREEIEKAIEVFEKKHGREPSPAEIAKIARETRDEKLAEVSTLEVRARQLGELTDAEYRQLVEVKRLAVYRTVERRTAGNETNALHAAVEHLFERKSVHTEHAILAEALNQDLGGLNLNALKVAFENHSEVIRLTQKPVMQSECATVQGLSEERWAVECVNGGKGRFDPLNPHFKPDGNLSDEQRRAVEAILNTKDQVFAFRGVAGSGKTTTLKEVTRGLENHMVHYLAPTTAAVKVLKEEGFRNATTVEDFLRKAADNPRLYYSVVICDEAGLQSNRQGAALLYLAERYQMRVLLVGDARQHVSVEAGDFLRVLEAHSQLGRCEVAEIRRQEVPEYKQAIMQMAHGNVREGLQQLDAMGWLKEGNADYLQHAADAYLKLRQGGAEDILVVAPTWRENDLLSESIRKGMRRIGMLQRAGRQMTVFNPNRWTLQQKRNFKNYTPGQVIIFNTNSAGWNVGDCLKVSRIEGKAVAVQDQSGKESVLKLSSAAAFEIGTFRPIEVTLNDKILIRANRKKLGLINGQVLTVSAVHFDGTIATQEGITIPADFKEWCHGYVVTSHKSQGRTCEHVIVAAERLDAKAAYVACSRGRQTCSIHTPDKTRLLAQLPEGNRKAALDVIAESPEVKIPAIIARASFWRKLVESLVYSYTAIREAIAFRLTGSEKQSVRRSIKI